MSLREDNGGRDLRSAFIQVFQTNSADLILPWNLKQNKLHTHTHRCVWWFIESRGWGRTSLHVLERAFMSVHVRACVCMRMRVIVCAHVRESEHKWKGITEQTHHLFSLISPESKRWTGWIEMTDHFRIDQGNYWQYGMIQIKFPKSQQLHLNVMSYNPRDVFLKTKLRR